MSDSSPRGWRVSFTVTIQARSAKMHSRSAFEHRGHGEDGRQAS